MDASLSLITLPAGLVLDYAGTSAPTGWLVCNGQAISRSTYSNLFTAIGTSFGVGDGSTTFNLPDLRGRTTIGVGQGSGLTNRTIGQSVGAETHVLTQDEMPSHTHTQNAHSHAISSTVPTSSAGSDISYSSASPQTTKTRLSATDNATATNQTTGSDDAHNNMQPSLVVNKIIKF